MDFLFSGVNIDPLPPISGTESISICVIIGLGILTGILAGSLGVV